MTWIWNFGGSDQTSNLINSVTLDDDEEVAMIQISLLVNTPQFLVSFAYLLYNNMFTSMQLAVEYHRFTRHAKSLRVTAASPGQRSTYWLQLPYKYCLPLMGAMFLLHWLISEGFYLVNIAVRDSHSDAANGPVLASPGKHLRLQQVQNMLIFP